MATQLDSKVAENIETMDVDISQEEEKKQNKLSPNQQLYKGLQKIIHSILKTVTTKEVRYVQRAIRQTFILYRRKLTGVVLLALIKKYFSSDIAIGDLLVNALNVVGVDSDEDLDTEKFTLYSQTPLEVEIYIALLVAVFLIDKNQIEQSIQVTNSLVERLEECNKRTLDPLSSKVYFYYSRAYELNGNLKDIRSKLLLHQRTAILRHNYPGQVTLLNLILRNYLHYNLFAQAEKLITKVELPSSHASSNELARYFFYSGKINALQLNYNKAYEDLQIALRKAPQNGARGFKSIVLKYSCIVLLLLGELPERNVFRTKGLQKILLPYLELTKVVRSGDLSSFHELVQNNKHIFNKDGTYNLIQRLRFNVIKTGLKKINAAYSRIPIADVCAKLNLGDISDGEFIIAKAIRDGIIDATINYDGKYIITHSVDDIYTTSEPQNALQDRIEFFLQIHNDAVKAMRYHEDKEEKKEEKKEEGMEEDNEGEEEEEEEMIIE